MHLNWRQVSNPCSLKSCTWPSPCFNCWFCSSGAEDWTNYLPHFMAQNCHWFQVIIEYLGIDFFLSQQLWVIYNCYIKEEGDHSQTWFSMSRECQNSVKGPIKCLQMKISKTGGSHSKWPGGRSWQLGPGQGGLSGATRPLTGRTLNSINFLKNKTKRKSESFVSWDQDWSQFFQHVKRQTAGQATSLARPACLTFPGSP